MPGSFSEEFPRSSCRHPEGAIQSNPIQSNPTEKGVSHTWSPDGKYIFFTGRDKVGNERSLCRIGPSFNARTQGREDAKAIRPLRLDGLAPWR
jgi:hypothetical protein